jgi:hypothetical protein
VNDDRPGAAPSSGLFVSAHARRAPHVVIFAPLSLLVLRVGGLESPLSAAMVYLVRFLIRST